MKKAIYAGSFDPITQGHLWLINQSAKLVDKLIIVLAFNPAKRGYFTVPERLSFLTNATKHLPNVEVVELMDQYLADYAKTHQVNYLIRGLRNTVDFEYEKTISRINQQINPSLETIYFTPPTSLEDLSSSVVKSLVGFPTWQHQVDKMVPSSVLSGFLRKVNEVEITKAWLSLSGDSDVSQKWLNIILDRYSESHRYYHNTNHLISLLNNARSLDAVLSLEELKVVNYSVFFHDLVYDPKSATNESDSAVLWELFTSEMNISLKIKEQVFHTILATKSHSQPVKHPVSEYFLDLDLSVLGSSEVEFNRYEKDIRAEYGFVPELDYNKARHGVMHRLIKPFKTQWGQDQWGTQSDLNLRKYQ